MVRKLPEKSPERLGSVARGNNSWYTPESGEPRDTLKVGTIRSQTERKRPGWEHQDTYTQSRNPAADAERYSYINDCSDVKHRDYSLRFSTPTKLSQDSYTVLPALKFTDKAVAASRIQPTVVVRARSTRMHGVAAPDRFSVRTQLPPL